MTFFMSKQVHNVKNKQVPDGKKIFTKKAVYAPFAGILSTIIFSHNLGRVESGAIKDGAYFCYCAYVMRVLGFPMGVAY